MNITTQFQQDVMKTLLEVRKNYGGSDEKFSRMYSLNPSVFSQLKNGKTEKLLDNGKWLRLGRELGVAPHKRKWNTAKTEVFTAISEDVTFCKTYAKSMMFVDACGIGKTYTATYLSKTIENCFYIDASQAKTEAQFVKLVAKAVGVNASDRIFETKEDIKYCLGMLDAPVVIIDEAGDLKPGAFNALKEFWNATEGVCGWYMMGAGSLRRKFDRGIKKNKEDYDEVFSRFSDRFMSIVPSATPDKMAFYMRLIRQVLSVNMEDKKELDILVKKSLVDENGRISGLRRAQSLLYINGLA